MYNTTQQSNAERYEIPAYSIKPDIKKLWGKKGRKKLPVFSLNFFVLKIVVFNQNMLLF